ncbi:glycosyltransferase family 2 protein [Bacteroidetes bacterium endosymbiont of Geopemphigus sp.]|uniref:glycosyltransferase family 2 protein n=1 Tax=Bacteroidetes bacterium endosymbiont of Geopemphigus sp. TaxID=2047937 RepID=UPI000CD0ACDF|nr:glycosyltransferase family 2 protein [Bacteroidetes bacterium endosymbiont of Geopemphigus sp.]
MNLAVVILNWNGVRWLEKFLPAIERFSQKSDLYVIDNASSDTSIDYLEKNHPSIKIIRHAQNLGFAGGYNKGIEQIHTKILCLLNSDVEVTEHWLKAIVSFFDNDHKLAVLQPKILDYTNKECFEYAGSAGGFIDNWGYPYCRGRIFYQTEIDTDQYEDSSEIFWASGACFFIRKSTYEEAGGFDEQFFAHMEEIDLCWRLRNKGYKIAYTASSKVYHMGGGTLKKEDPEKTFLNFRNSLLMLVKNLPLKELYKVLTGRLFLDGWAGVYFLLHGHYKHSWAIVRAHFSFYKRFFINYQKRSGEELSAYYRHRNIFFQYFIMGRKYFHKLR